MAFDNDDILDDTDDEDLISDPVSQMDMQVHLIFTLVRYQLKTLGRQAHLVSFFRECAARNTSNFSVAVEQMTAEEMLVIRRVVSE